MRRNSTFTLSTETRRRMVMDDLRTHPLSSAREISDRILRDTRGVLGPGQRGLYIPSYRILSDLKLLETYGQVRRFQVRECRSISWQAVEARVSA